MEAKLPESPANQVTLWARKCWPIFAATVGLSGWFVFSCSTSKDITFFCYPCIALTGVAVMVLTQRRWRYRATKAGGILLTLTVIVAWGYNDTYEIQWVDANTRFADTYKRWSDQFVYRKFSVYDSPKAAQQARFVGLGEVSAKGPMAGTGKPHGSWEYTQWKPKWQVETKFYWYGEEVSEGEWHLRNR